jgi:hypothetical protein
MHVHLLSSLMSVLTLFLLFPAGSKTECAPFFYDDFSTYQSNISAFSDVYEMWCNYPQQRFTFNGSYGTFKMDPVLNVPVMNFTGCAYYVKQSVIPGNAVDYVLEADINIVSFSFVSLTILLHSYGSLNSCFTILLLLSYDSFI